MVNALDRRPVSTSPCTYKPGGVMSLVTRSDQVRAAAQYIAMGQKAASLTRHTSPTISSSELPSCEVAS